MQQVCLYLLHGVKHLSISQNKIEIAMWEFTKINEKEVNNLYNYFLPKFPTISPKCLFERILSGYCYGEGGKIWLMNIKEWEAAFKGDKFFTCFKDWDDYLKYRGDCRKKLNALYNKN